MRIIHRACRIITDDGTGTKIPLTDATRGLLNGEFHWLTDQTPFANDQTLSGDGIVTADDQYWYINIITKNSMGNPVRMVDIVDGGSYGTNSGWGLKIDNTNGDAQAFWVWLAAQGIELQNRRIEHYAFISEDSGATWVSFQRWGGVISNNPFTAKDYEIQCRSSFFIDSDIFPEKVLSKSNFPSLDASLENTPERIALGFVERAEAIKLTSPVPVAMGYTPQGPLSASGAKVFSILSLSYITLQGQNPALILLTTGITFTANQLAGFLLQSTDGNESVSIIGNDATAFLNGGTLPILKVYLSGPLAADNSINEDNYSNKYATEVDYSTDYQGLGVNFRYATITATSALTGWPVTPTLPAVLYLIGTNSGASAYYQHDALASALAGVPVRRLFSPGEVIYLSSDPKRTSLIVDDTALAIGDFNTVVGFVRGTTTASGQVFVTITASGSTNTLNIYRDAGHSHLIAHATYTAPGVISIVADAASGIGGSITVNNMTTNSGITITLGGISDQVYGSSLPCVATLSAVTYKVPAGNNEHTLLPDRVYDGTDESVLYYNIFQNILDYQASENAIGEYVSTKGRGAVAYFDSASKTYSDISQLIKSKDAGDSNPYQSPFISIASSQSVDGSKFAIYSPLVPSVATFEFNTFATYQPQNLYLLHTVVNNPILTDLDRTTYISRAFTNTADIHDTLFFKAFPGADFTKQKFDSIYMVLDFKVISSGFTYSFAVQYFYYDVNGNLIGFDNGYIFPFPRAAGVDQPGGLFFNGANHNYLPNSYFVGGNDGGVASAFPVSYYDKQGVAVQAAQKFLLPSRILKNKGVEFGFGLLALDMNTKHPTSMTNSFETRYQQIGFVGVNTVDLTSQSIYLRIIGEKNNDGQPASDLFRAVGYFLQKDGLIASFADLPGNLNSPLLYTGSGEPLFPIGRQLTEQRTSKDWITDMCRQGWFCLFPNRKNEMTAVNWLIRNRPADVSFSDSSSNIAHRVSAEGKDQGLDIAMERTDWKRVYNNFTFNYHQDPNLGWRGVIAVSNASAPSFPGIYDSTNPDGDDTTVFTSVIVVNQGGRWIARVTTTTPGLTVGAVMSFFGSDIGLSIFFSPITAKSGAGPYVYSFDLGTTFSGIPGVSSTVGTWRLQGSAIPLWATYVSGLPTGAASWQTASDLWTPCHAAYVQTLAIQDAPSNLTDMTWFVDKGLFYNDPIQQPLTTLAALNSAKNHAYWSTKQKDVFSYSIPLTAATALREILQFGSFNDEIYTNSVTRHGWLHYIEDDVKTDTLKLKLTVNPDGAVTPTTIFETGDAADSVIESGNRTNNIVETGSA